MATRKKKSEKIQEAVDAVATSTARIALLRSLKSFSAEWNAAIQENITLFPARMDVVLDEIVKNSLLYAAERGFVQSIEIEISGLSAAQKRVLADRCKQDKSSVSCVKRKSFLVIRCDRKDSKPILSYLAGPTFGNAVFEIRNALPGNQP